MRLLSFVSVLVTAGLVYAAEGHGPAPSIFSTDFLFRLINFSILFGGLGYVLAKPLKNFLKERSAAVRQAILDARKAKEDAEEKARYYETKLSRLESEISAMMDEFRKEAEDEKVRIIRDAQDQIEKTRERMVKSLEQEKIKMREEVMSQASVMALKLAEELIRKNFSPADQKKWVRDYISMMEKIH